MSEEVQVPSPSLLRSARMHAAAIILGRLRSDATVEVVTVLYGQLPVGSLSFGSESGLTPGVDDRLVIMVDDNLEILSFARLLAGPSLERGVLIAHERDPTGNFAVSGVFTLAQLEVLMQTGELQQDYSVVLWFSDGRGGREQSPHGFEVHNDSGEFRLAGLTGACAGEQPVLFWWTGEQPRLLVDLGPCSAAYAAPCRASRLLELHGAVAGLDDQGDIMLEVMPTQPFLHRSEYDRLVGDRSIGVESNFVEIELDMGERWTWRVPADVLVDPKGVEHISNGSSGARAPVDDGRAFHYYYDQEYLDAIELRLDMVLVADARPEPLLQHIEAGRVECGFFDGERDRACDFGAVGVVFGDLPDRCQ